MKLLSVDIDCFEFEIAAKASCFDILNLHINDVNIRSDE